MTSSLAHLCSFHKDYGHSGHGVYGHSGYGHSGYGSHSGYSDYGYGGYYGYKKRSVDKNCGKIEIDADFLICGIAVAGALAAFALNQAIINAQRRRRRRRRRRPPQQGRGVCAPGAKTN